MSRPNKPDRCHTWPGCVCGRLWLHWQSAIGDLEPEPSEIECARVMLEAMLSCVAYRCPDGRFRSQATLQLLHPIWKDDHECAGNS